MKNTEVAAHWQSNAETWTVYSRAGYDKYRDALNTPAFLAMLPSVEGLAGLDLGCGEGANTRAVAELGARMTGVDIAPAFIRHAQELEMQTPLGVEYSVCNAEALPFPDASFDFVTAFMSLMDMANQGEVLAGVHRILKPGGFLQFSGIPDVERAGLTPFSVPRFHRTLTSWVSMILGCGLTIEAVGEPMASPEVALAEPVVADTRIAPLFLHIRARKPRPKVIE